MDITLLSNFAMFMLFIGTLPSILSAYKSRKNLLAFSLTGSIALVIGQMGYLIYFILIGDYMTSILSTIPTAFWWLVIIYKIESLIK